MEKNEIVKKIHHITKSDKDKGLQILEILSLVKDSDPTTLLAHYKKLVDGDLVIVEILSKNELTQEQKDQLTKKIQAKFSDKELIFDYIVSPRNSVGILIKIGDNVLDGTL